MKAWRIMASCPVNCLEACPFMGEVLENVQTHEYVDIDCSGSPQETGSDLWCTTDHWLLGKWTRHTTGSCPWGKTLPQGDSTQVLFEDSGLS